jgi:hypothetical protein
MKRPRGQLARGFLAATLLALLVLGAASCSVGAGGSAKGGADLVVTRDFGARHIAAAHEEPIPGGETVMRLLMRNAKVKTRYSGRFVNGVNGVESNATRGRRFDWFYYVNGVEADVGAAERKLAGGDRVWWDYHDWSSVMRVPAVVGSFPEPFLHGSEGKRYPVRIDCAQDAESACRDVADRLEAAGVAPSTSAIGAAAGKELLRLVVGPWSEVRRDGAAEQLEEGPEKSGVFARFAAAGSGAYTLDLLDAQGRVVRALGARAGLVAATRFEEQQPTWIVAGTDEAGLERAVALVDRTLLRDRFALASDGSRPIPLPAEGQS